MQNFVVKCCSGDFHEAFFCFSEPVLANVYLKICDIIVRDTTTRWPIETAVQFEGKYQIILENAFRICRLQSDLHVVHVQVC